MSDDIYNIWVSFQEVVSDVWHGHLSFFKWLLLILLERFRDVEKDTDSTSRTISESELPLF